MIGVLIMNVTLLHAGVKGMRWGVRKDDRGSNHIPHSEKSKIRKHLDSMKRERQWRSVIKELDKMSTRDIQILAKRLGSENSLKSLSKAKVANSKDKDDYLRRHEMDDQELSRKITRLQAKNNLYKAVVEASKEQVELGEKVVNLTGSLGVKYVSNKKLTIKDVYEVAKSHEKHKELGKQAKKDAGKIFETKLKDVVDKKTKKV